jgi:hypothetical protein
MFQMRVLKHSQPHLSRTGAPAPSPAFYTLAGTREKSGDPSGVRVHLTSECVVRRGGDLRRVVTGMVRIKKNPIGASEQIRRGLREFLTDVIGWTHVARSDRGGRRFVADKYGSYLGFERSADEVPRVFWVFHVRQKTAQSRENGKYLT